MNNQKLNNILRDPNTNWKYIAIVAVAAVVALVGILIYQNFWLRSQEISMTETLKKEIETPEISKQSEIPANWKTYTNEEYGFEISYPSKVKIGDVRVEEKSERTFEDMLEERFLGKVTTNLHLEIPYLFEEAPFQSEPLDLNLDSKVAPVCYSRFMVRVVEAFSLPSIEELKNEFSKSEIVIVGGTKGVRINQFIGQPPGGGGAQDKVYLFKDSKAYLVYYIIDREILGTQVNAEKCFDIQEKTFNQILSTFKFLE